MLIIDSNIWGYYFDRDSREHSSVVSKVEDSLKKEKVVLNTVIVIELSHFLIKNLGAVEGKEKLFSFIAFPFTIDELDLNTTTRAAELLAKYSHYGIGGRDATILATAEKLSLTKIMTHDKSFKKIDWLNVVDPISD